MRFNMQVRCEQCKGSGIVESTLYVQDIMIMVLHNVEDGVIQKIPAIKQVRDEYGIGLRQAKELVEGAMEFYSVIQKHASEIPNVGDEN
mgnify:CR=1 FL=1|tara:strand:- start:2180 stop:2446 length:267 start_codon:yes stop_codon:yes gene_type:complete